MMLHVFERRVGPLHGPVGRTALLGVLGVLALTTSACGGDGGPVRAEAAAATTSVPATIAASTTVAAAPTTQATTTTSTVPLPRIGSTTVFATSTTVAVQETEPIAPPLDAWASEPIIEMGTISIPRIGVSMTMYEGIRLTTLDRGPGHWPGSALPGRPGNVVVAGHRSSEHEVFRDVDQLVAGDEIVFDDDDGRHVYEVDRIEIVEPDAVWIVDPTETPTVTLFACHPPGSTRQRIVVFADLVTA